MTGSPLELFRKVFGAVRAISCLCGSLLAPEVKQHLPTRKNVTQMVSSFQGALKKKIDSQDNRNGHP